MFQLIARSHVRIKICQGVLPAESTVQIPLRVRVLRLDEQLVTASFRILGSEHPPHPVTIGATGEGPVVHISPSKMNWDKTPVLKEVQQV